MCYKESLGKNRHFTSSEINEFSSVMRCAKSLKTFFTSFTLAESHTFVNRSVCEVMVQKLCILHEHEGVADMGASGVWVHTYRDQPWTG
jgi:hypothetical protein